MGDKTACNIGRLPEHLVFLSDLFYHGDISYPDAQATARETIS